MDDDVSIGTSVPNLALKFAKLCIVYTVERNVRRGCSQLSHAVHVLPITLRDVTGTTANQGRIFIDLSAA